ncbi:MAG: response regulator [Treponema sp.]|nr:response regulator [Treponema sp.]
MTILIVDDDPIAGEISQAIIESENYTTLLAEGAAEAGEILASHPEISAIVSDHHMPGMSGIAFYQSLSATGPGLPFILLSGDEPATLISLAPGIDAVVEKDGSLATSLPATLARLLAGRDGERRP